MNNIEKTIEAVRTDPQLLAESWAELDAQGQIELIKSVTLSQKLIASNWNSIGDEDDQNQFRFLCCKHQQLTPTFLIEHWCDLEVDAKYASMLLQEQLPDELVKDFWESLNTKNEDEVIETDEIIRAFASTVRPERQPEGYTTSEETCDDC